ncbi:MAG TPA: radical SAM protein [Patescibacteria group bacterium]|nr:radical SAM protein [Patescibacteria group bacterium]
MIDIDKYYGHLTESQLESLKKHLLSRYEYRKNKKNIGIVFDILHRCDLVCRGCGTDAKYTNEKKVLDPFPTLSEIEMVFAKIKTYAEEKNMPVFINIGGGEPFLRHDIYDVLKLASEYFGINGVGVDTNGTLDNSLELITNVLPYVSYVGISLNGLEDYHNWWAGNSKINAYKRTLSVIQNICSNSELSKKIEVTSVATKRNMNELPVLMRILSEIGVVNYSVHRAIPVGRMAKLSSIILNADEYLKLLINMIEKSSEIGLDVHLHHSIESIHASLLLGINTYASDKVGNPDAGSSLGIEPNGALVFDPWCTTGLWKSLSGGNLYIDSVTFHSLVEGDGGTVFDLAKIYTAPHLRCNGCPIKCSGGSRIASTANVLNELQIADITDSHILDAMTSIDPACPLYKKSEI